MTGMEGFSFTQVMTLVGLAQCLLIVIYIGLRARNRQQGALPLLYFLVLGFVFLFDFLLAGGLRDPWMLGLSWLGRLLGAPLCYLVIVQIAREDLPRPRDFLILTVPAIAMMAGLGAVSGFSLCAGNGLACENSADWLRLSGVISSAVALLAIWGQRYLLPVLRAQPSGRERYILALSLIGAHVAYEAVTLMSIAGLFGWPQALLARTFLALTLVYLASTLLFRIYPQPLPTEMRPARTTETTTEPAALPSVSSSGSTGPSWDELTPNEKALAEKVKTLMELEKVYQDPAYSRASLARELGVGEHVISKLVSATFGKGFRPLLNERRVEDAKYLLRTTQMPVTEIAFESGFNSLASFNRVFREVADETPSDYRARSSNKI